MNRDKQEQTGINRNEHQGNNRQNKKQQICDNIDQTETNMDSKKQKKRKEQKKNHENIKLLAYHYTLSHINTQFCLFMM